VSTTEIQDKGKYSARNAKNPSSVGNLNSIDESSMHKNVNNIGGKKNNENLKVSLGEIGKLKQMAKGGNIQGTPRPNLAVVNEREGVQNNSMQKGCFMKKGTSNNSQHPGDRKTSDKERNVDINQSIHSRKEKIDQLLSRYGKGKDGSLFLFNF
jgi:hypothetical protein